jgi:hypothetical protein
MQTQNTVVDAHTQLVAAPALDPLSNRNFEQQFL